MSCFFLNPGLQRDFTEMLMKVQCFLMNVYLNAMAELQKKRKKQTLKKTFFSKWQSVFNNSKEMLRSSQILHTTAK